MTMLLSTACNLGSAVLPTQNILVATEAWLQWLTKESKDCAAALIRPVIKAFFTPRFLGAGGDYKAHYLDLNWMALEVREGEPVWMPDISRDARYVCPSAGFDNTGSTMDGVIWVRRDAYVSLGLLSRAYTGDGIATEFFLLAGSHSAPQVSAATKDQLRTSMADVVQICRELEKPSEVEPG